MRRYSWPRRCWGQLLLLSRRRKASPPPLETSRISPVVDPDYIAGMLEVGSITRSLEEAEDVARRYVAVYGVPASYPEWTRFLPVVPARDPLAEAARKALADEDEEENEDPPSLPPPETDPVVLRDGPLFYKQPPGAIHADEPARPAAYIEVMGMHVPDMTGWRPGRR